MPRGAGDRHAFSRSCALSSGGARTGARQGGGARCNDAPAGGEARHARFQSKRQAGQASDLIDLLHVLGRLVALEPQQAALLEAILAGDLEDNAKLSAAGALAASQDNGAD